MHLTHVQGRNGMSVEPAQIKAARALLGWTQTELSDAAGMALRTIVSIERGTGSGGATNQLVGFLSTKGIAFGNGDAGHDLVVRLRRKDPARALAANPSPVP
jgi:DNA-binding XRE family transcriptional regulator